MPVSAIELALRRAAVLCALGALGALGDARAQTTSATPSMRPPQADAATDDKAFANARYSTILGAGGLPLNVVEIGDPSRPAILLIHGFRQSHLSWIRQFDAELAANCHLVAFDLRGHGNSGLPWNPEAYDNSALWGEDVANVIRATGIVKPLVVGWSYGGNVAMDFARHFPEVPVAGYVLVGSAAGMFTAPPTPPNTSVAPVRPTWSPSLVTNIAGVAASGSVVFPTSLDPTLRRWFDAAAMRVSPFVDRAIARRGASTNTDVIATIHAPVTLVFGGRDPVVTLPLQQRLIDLFRAARVVSFPEAGHAPFLEDAARFNALLEAGPCKASP